MEQNDDLSRFSEAHRTYYDQALSEIRAGKKRTHWMWFIFPQMRGLGVSVTSRYYGIGSVQEARRFLDDPYLGKNLREITAALLELQTSRASDVFDPPDDMKLRSCMTLFANLPGADPVFGQALRKFFNGTPCRRTLTMIQTLPEGEK